MHFTGNFERFLDLTGYTRMTETIKSLLLPTSTKHFKTTEKSIADCYKSDIAELKNDRNTIRHLMLATRAKRTKVLEDLRKEFEHKIKNNYGKEVHIKDAWQICDAPGHGTELRNSGIQFLEAPSHLDPELRLSTLNPDVDSLTEEQEALVSKYLHYVETTRQLRAHLEDVDTNLEDFEYMVKTQAVAELTTYRGFNDWGETMYGYVNNYATGLAGLSIAGAGLVYSTIFSRQDHVDDPVGLMSLTFPLFTVGFLIPGFVYIAICWARNLPRSVTFASQRFWTAAMLIALAVATIMVLGAIIIVNVTILRIGANRKAWSLARIAGAVSLIFSGSIIAMALLAIFLGCFSRKMRITAQEYWSGAKGKERDALNTYNHV